MENKIESKTFTREELYDLIWSTPMTSIMKKYVVSRHGLQKICKEMKVPSPKSGYWEKLKVRKEVNAEKLPMDYKGKGELELLVREEGDNSKTGPEPELALLQKEIESNPEIILTVPERLSKPDPVIIKAKENIEERKRQKYAPWPGLGINVSFSNMNRTFIFLDTLIKAIKTRGHNFIVRDDSMYIVIKKEEFKIDFRNKRKRIELPKKYSWKEYDYEDTGVIIFRSQAYFYGDMEWKDDKTLLETKISNVIAKLEIRERSIAEERTRIEKWHTAYQAKLQKERDYAASIKKEKEDFNILLDKAQRWNEARLIRDYLNDIEKRAKANNVLTEGLVNSIKWARKKADWYDPSENIEDELLGIYK